MAGKPAGGIKTETYDEDIMQLTEDLIPLDRRYLPLHGLASAASLELVAAALPGSIPATSRICFVGYAYADLILPRRFGILFDLERPATGVKTDIIITAATQQFALRSGEITHGWQTICVIDFPRGVPAIVDEMPSVHSWKNAPRLGICEGYAYRSIAESIERSRMTGRG